MLGIFSLLFITIGCAYLNATLSINGNTTIASNTWDIHFENLRVTTGSVTATTPAAIQSNTTMISYSVLLDKPVHFHFIPRYKSELMIFNKVYRDRHFGYNFWKWALSRFKCQKDIFTKEERIKIFEMMKEEFDLK